MESVNTPTNGPLVTQLLAILHSQTEAGEKLRSNPEGFVRALLSARSMDQLNVPVNTETYAEIAAKKAADLAHRAQAEEREQREKRAREAEIVLAERYWETVVAPSIIIAPIQGYDGGLFVFKHGCSFYLAPTNGNECVRVSRHFYDAWQREFYGFDCEDSGVSIRADAYTAYSVIVDANEGAI